MVNLRFYETYLLNQTLNKNIFYFMIQLMYRITNNPEIWDKSRMNLEGYPELSREEYFVYTIEPIVEPWTAGVIWEN